MNQGSPKSRRRAYAVTAALLAAACPGLVGCQTEIGGQMLPSPYYLSDDVQYFAPGPEFKLANEAAALKAQKEARASERQPAGT